MIVALMRPELEAVKASEIGDATAEEQLRLLVENVVDYALTLVRAMWLQWGHGIAAVESASSPPPAFLTFVLQWGHGIAAVESR